MTKKIQISLIILLLLQINLLADFGPANAAVTIGDQNYQDPVKIKRHKPNQSKSIYSGPQGGAYFMLRFFQIVISPQDGPSCRYHPCCSNYAKQAVKMHGSLLGSFLAGDRILRCNPYNKPGHDSVPKHVFSN